MQILLVSLLIWIGAIKLGGVLSLKKLVFYNDKSNNDNYAIVPQVCNDLLC